LLIYLPALYWLTRLYGISGAAAAYAGLNVYYVFSLVPLVQARVIGQGFGVWLRQNLLPFALVGIGAFGGAKIIASTMQPGWSTVVLLALGAAAYAAATWFLLSVSLRSDLTGALKRVMSR